MAIPKILVLSGSIRSGSHNVRLAALAVKELTLADADVTRISLEDYPLPLYDADLESKSGVPGNAVGLKQMFCAHHGVFLASPEYNGSVSPLLKNAIDWVSRLRERGEPPLPAFKHRVFALGSASPTIYGGVRGLMALRLVLEVGCGALVLPEQVTVANAVQAFDAMDNLIDARSAERLRLVVQKLIEMARLML